MNYIKPKDFNATLRLNGSRYNEWEEAVTDTYAFGLPSFNLGHNVCKLFMDINREILSGICKLEDIKEVFFEVKENKVIVTIMEVKRGNHYTYEDVDEKCKKEIPLHDVFDNSYIVLAEYQDHKIVFKKYRLSSNEDETIIIDESAKIVLTLSDNILSYEISNEADEETFFSNVSDTSGIYESFAKLIFDKYTTYHGMKDIYIMLKNLFNGDYKNVDLDPFNQYMFYKNLLNEDFYFLIEKRIKENFQYEEVFKLNPVFTHEPFSAHKEVLSKKAKEFAMNNRFNNTNELRQLQENPNVGIDGIGLLIDFFNDFNILKKEYEIGYPDYADNYITYLNEIFEAITITPKQIIDKMIRAAINTEFGLTQYLNIVVDYMTMCKLLKIPFNGIPQDLEERHDQLCSQIREIRDGEINESFKEMVKVNLKLLEYLPENENFVIIAPDTSNDLIKEGLALSHCVGSYINQYASGNSKIFFLRRKEQPEVSYATIELNKNNDLVQIKGFCNRRPDKDAYQYAVQWVNSIGGNIYE